MRMHDFKVGDRVRVLDVSEFRGRDPLYDSSKPIFGRVKRIEADSYPPILVQHDEPKPFLHDGLSATIKLPENTGWWYESRNLELVTRLSLNPDIDVSGIL